MSNVSLRFIDRLALYSDLFIIDLTNGLDIRQLGRKGKREQQREEKRRNKRD